MKKNNDEIAIKEKVKLINNYNIYIYIKKYCN